MTRTALALLAAGALIAGENDWPQYRGPGGAGIAKMAAPVEFGPKLNRLWTAEVPAGHSSPAVWGDSLYLTAFDATAKELVTLAYDLRSGRMRWRQVAPASEIEKVHQVSNPATATPALDGERVYAYFGSAGLFCYDLAGKLVWSEPMPVAKIQFGSGTSPVLAGRAVILAREGSDAHLTAFERESGKQLWDVKLAGMGQFSGHATPLVWKDQIVLHRAGEVSGFDASSGERRWWVNVVSQGTGTPVIHGDMLFVGAWGADPELRDPLPAWDELLKKYDKDGNGSLSKEEFPDDLAFLRRAEAGKTQGAVVTFKMFFGQLDFNKDGQIAKGEWEFMSKMFTSPPPLPNGLIAIKLGGEKDMTKSNVVWSEQRAVPEVPVPLVLRGRVYSVTNGGIISALDESTGKLIYRSRLGAGGLYYSSPVAAGDHVYFASAEGVVSVVRAGDKLDVAARNDLGEPIFATPAVVEGRLYVRTAKHLWAFGN